MRVYSFFIALLFLFVSFSSSIKVGKPLPLTEEEEEWLSRAQRRESGGWTYLSVSGSPYEIGFQHGYSVAQEYASALNAYVPLTYWTTGMTYQFFVDQAVALHKSKIPSYLLEEMQGIADGLTKAGVNSTLNDIIGWNAWQEITGYWWPTVASSYGSLNPPKGSMAKSHCSAFIATGSATTDGQIVIGHETFTEFWNGQYMNLVLDITPTSGNRIIFQTSPGWIASMTDFWFNSAGIVVVETTIVGFVGYNVSGIPEYVRARNATQFANSVDEWVELIASGNNGGYANMWLVGDINTNEIASYEQGLIYQNLTKKYDGYFFGENAPNDPRIRNLECSDVGYDDIRQQTGARRTRWPQLLSQYDGQIDDKVGAKMLGDTYDVYLQKENPSSRTICAHYDEDPQYYASDPNAVWNIPYYPAGSVDGKVTTASLVKQLGMFAVFGRADGQAFDAQKFLQQHTQYNWQNDYLQSRPAQPWVYLYPNTSFSRAF